MTYYFLMLMGDICAAISILMAYYSSYKPSDFNRFCDVAEFGHQDPARINKDKHPWYRIDRLWRCVVLGMGIIGLLYISYGISNHLFGWLPFLESKNEPFLGVLMMILTGGIMAFLSYVHRIALKHHFDAN